MMAVQPERSVNTTKKKLKTQPITGGGCKGVNVVPGMGEQRPGGAPLQKHLLVRERQRPGERSFPFPFIPSFLWIVHGNKLFPPQPELDYD